MEQWIIPCNSKFYDINGAFKKLKCLDWKQSNKTINIGDEIFIYVSSPINAIKYKCRVNKVNLPHIEIDDTEFIINGNTYISYGNYMELELIEEFDNMKYTLNVLKSRGLKGNIQGPRRAKNYIK